MALRGSTGMMLALSSLICFLGAFQGADAGVRRPSHLESTTVIYLCGLVHIPSRAYTSTDYRTRAAVETAERQLQMTQRGGQVTYPRATMAYCGTQSGYSCDYSTCAGDRYVRSGSCGFMMLSCPQGYTLVNEARTGTLAMCRNGQLTRDVRCERQYKTTPYPYNNFWRK